MKHIFIVNTIVAKVGYGQELRQHLEERGDVDFFVFNTSKAGMEHEIVEKMIKIFEGQKLRFYCCGGSGTMRNIMQGTSDYKDVEFAFCPQGQTNDFLKMFGDNFDQFKDIDNLIDGHVELIDYIRTDYGFALNTVSFGIDSVLSETLTQVQEYNIFGKSVPFLIAYVNAIVNSKPHQVICKIDDKEIEGKLSEMVVTNGNVFGGQMHLTDKADCRDGIMDYVMGFNISRIKMLKAILSMIKNDINEVHKSTECGTCRKYTLTSLEGKDLSLNLDGEIIKGGSEWNIEVVNKGMRFVMPKGLYI